jgi:hypothetical protein
VLLIVGGGSGDAAEYVAVVKIVVVSVSTSSNRKGVRTKEERVLKRRRYKRLQKLSLAVAGVKKIALG